MKPGIEPAIQVLMNACFWRSTEWSPPERIVAIESRPLIEEELLCFDCIHDNETEAKIRCFPSLNYNFKQNVPGVASQ
jgi:hypothetical protein